ADDADRLDEAAEARLQKARRAGARIVLVAENRRAISLPAVVFSVPPLETEAAKGLLVRAIPSLPDSLIPHVLTRTEARPGALRRLVRNLEGKPMVTAKDLDRAL